MSANSQPITPFHVNAVYLKSPPEQSVQGPNGGSGSGLGHSQGMFGNGGFTWWHLAALPLFAGLYWLVQNKPAFCVLSIFVLLACVLFRLDPTRRRLSLAPVTFAAIMLAGHIGEFLARPIPPNGKVTLPADFGLTWLPSLQ
ncbi:MAG: hypothetical protein L0Z53_22425 [Acidobacteriales bacterium]|nr:hypothetical protein [Terriglobales bacterium]